MTVQLTEDVRWINECYEQPENHLHIGVYLLTFEDANVLVDTGSFYHSQRIREELDALLSGDPIDTVFLSNPDYIHAGNVGQYLGETEVVSFVGTPERHGYEGATTTNPGESRSVAGRRFSFIDPVLADIASSAWIYDHGSNGLFTSDGFGQYHAAGACEKVSTDFESGIAYEDVRGFHEDTLRWLEYVDPDEIRAAVDKIFDSYDVRRIYPAHGHPIEGDDVARFLEQFHRAVQEIAGG